MATQNRTKEKLGQTIDNSYMDILQICLHLTNIAEVYAVNNNAVDTTRTHHMTNMLNIKNIFEKLHVFPSIF